MDLKELATLAEGFTGADLGGLVREASLQALKSSLLEEESSDLIDEPLCVKKQHFVDALQNIKPSVSDEVK